MYFTRADMCRPAVQRPMQSYKLLHQWHKLVCQKESEKAGSAPFWGLDKIQPWTEQPECLSVHFWYLIKISMWTVFSHSLKHSLKAVSGHKMCIQFVEAPVSCSKTTGEWDILLDHSVMLGPQPVWAQDPVGEHRSGSHSHICNWIKKSSR